MTAESERKKKEGEIDDSRRLRLAAGGEKKKSGARNFSGISSLLHAVSPSVGDSHGKLGQRCNFFFLCSSEPDVDAHRRSPPALL